MAKTSMHCDEKRIMYVLKQEIEHTWKELRNSNFQNQKLLNDLTESIKEYEEYKKMLRRD